MRELKIHQKKLLRRVNLYDWKKERQHRRSNVVRNYCLDDAQDYARYAKLCGLITSLVSKLQNLPPADPFRVKLTDQLLTKLYHVGLISNNNDIHAAQKMTVAAFCKRRLPVVLKDLKFAQSVREAVNYVQQGHVRVGVDVQTDPAYLISRNLEDHVGWTNRSTIKRKIQDFRDERDDFQLQ